jgi:L-fuconolactonase
MIGSDWPVCTVAGDYVRVMDVVKDHVSKLSPVVQEAILGGNATTFWRLQEIGAELS